MKMVEYWENPDGTWTGRIFETTFTGSREQVLAWIYGPGWRA